MGVVPIYPTGQVVHAVLAEGEYSPSSHKVQLLDGGIEPLVPGEHEEQDIEPGSENSPLRQGL